MKFQIHSTTDLITNSSTTIYTYSDGSADACKEMINEIFDTFDIDKKCEDVFTLILLFDNVENYRYWLDRQDQPPFTGDVNKLVDKILSCKVEKPKWMFEVEENSENTFGGTVLHICAKNKKYEKIAKLVSKFLYSTFAEESSS